MNRLTVAVVGVVLLALGYTMGSANNPTVVTVRDTVTPFVYAARLDGLRLENEGLRARIAGLETRAPETVTVTDTVVLPPDTVLRFVNVDGDARLTVEAYVSVPTVQGTAYRPELHERIDVSDCDDGWQIQSGTVICNRARLGHLWAGVNAGTTMWTGLWWRPSFRSPWTVSVGRTADAWEAGVSWGLRLW